MENTYTINEESARAAWDCIHMSEYKENSQTNYYNSRVAECMEIAEKQKEKVNPYWHDKIDYYADLYCRKLAENMNATNSAESSMPSWVIAGPSNYNVKKWNKVQARVDSLMEEREKIYGLLDKIKSIGTGGISSDLPEAEKLIQDKINRLTEENEIAKAANKYIKKNGTLSGFEYEGKTLKPNLENNFFNGKFNTSYNSAEIRRLKKRLEEMAENREISGWEFDGGTVEADKEDNRLKIFFDDKPESEMRYKLKSHGFRFAPSTAAWQRQLTKNAVRDVKYYFPELMPVQAG